MFGDRYVLCGAVFIYSFLAKWVCFPVLAVGASPSRCLPTSRHATHPWPVAALRFLQHGEPFAHFCPSLTNLDDIGFLGVQLGCRGATLLLAFRVQCMEPFLKVVHAIIGSLGTFGFRVSTRGIDIGRLPASSANSWTESTS